jgi:hypothetical protein
LICLGVPFLAPPPPPPPKFLVFFTILPLDALDGFANICQGSGGGVFETCT